MKFLQKIKELYQESARVANEYLQNQISAIDNLKTPNFLKEIYKADVISKTLEGRALFADY